METFLQFRVELIHYLGEIKEINKLSESLDIFNFNEAKEQITSIQ